MIKYFHIIIFLMTKDTAFLKECWQVEVIKKKKFSWLRLARRLFSIKRRGFNNIYCFFWWRLASEMHFKGSKRQTKIARKIYTSLIFKYNLDIMLGSVIGKGFKLAHTNNVTINNNTVIGVNCTVMQNVTIGQNNDLVDIKIGDNVFIGTGTVILGGIIRIGSNTNIGAMSFINKDVPNNCTVYTEKTNKIIYS